MEKIIEKYWQYHVKKKINLGFQWNGRKKLNESRLTEFSMNMNLDEELSINSYHL